MEILYKNKSISVNGSDIDKIRFFGLLAYGFTITKEMLPGLINEMFELEGDVSYDTPLTFKVLKHGNSYSMRLMDDVNNIPADKVYYELVFDLAASNSDTATIYLVENKLKKKNFDISMKTIKRKVIYFEELDVELRY